MGDPPVMVRVSDWAFHRGEELGLHDADADQFGTEDDPYPTQSEIEDGTAAGVAPTWGAFDSMGQTVENQTNLENVSLPSLPDPSDVTPWWLRPTLALVVLSLLAFLWGHLFDIGIEV